MLDFPSLPPHSLCVQQHATIAALHFDPMQDCGGRGIHTIDGGNTGPLTWMAMPTLSGDERSEARLLRLYF
jgi:hypothetical protein